MQTTGRLAAALPPIWVHQAIGCRRRYLPLRRAKPRQLLYKVKTVPTKNERDGGCPNRYRQRRADTKVMSILGSKIDRFCDLSDHIGGTVAKFQFADPCLLLCEQA